jgi:hypothetical protein
MKKSRGLFVVIILLAAIAAGYFWWKHNQPEPAPPVPDAPAVEAPQPVEPPVMAAVPPPVQHPIEPAPVEETLPEVQNSDQLLTQALQPLTGSELWRFLFLPDMIVQHVVATVDNLPRSEVSTKVWPVRPAGSWLQTENNGGELQIAASNSQRYAQYVELVQKIDIAKLAEVYRQFYPLFQRAYVQLGYPDGYFNDRLVFAIDDLLAAPEPTEPPSLVQNKVLYQYADPDLESRSAGQKIMLRIGVDNERIVKTKLRALRAEITKARPVPQK